MTGWVGLSYDDGPHPDTTMALLTALRAGGALATFFIWGEHARRHPDLLRAVADAGMWIGNHTYTHPYLTQLAEPAVVGEIARTQDTIHAITGQEPGLFRPPYGDTDARVRTLAGEQGLAEVLWTVDTRDWAGAGAADIVDAAATLTDGDIILMHDLGYQATIDAVAPILAGLAARDLRPGRIVPHSGQNGAVAVAP
ncbi:MAG TPA: polysaccharide deacetylase family protein [Micromonosporaceae bacterium]|nr:polysaccharide deacetylase family protein [Micromonosporaceae bacterium]